MKKSQILAIAALAAAATFQTTAKAEDPVSPVQGAVCNLYLLDVWNSQHTKEFTETANSLPSQPAVATFVDMASEFKPSKKMSDVASSWGMWTGWLKQEKAGTYTFLCRRAYGSSTGYSDNHTWYSIWINGEKCIGAGAGQEAFNVDLSAGFNSVKIVAESYSNADFPLTITYKKAGGLKEPVAFGPGDMFHDDEE
ncbi:MAG: hypothetical protein IK066_03220 [Kiritimatiellae bacterium]|nr:hypothetical protein [Kiritimatiellia bacterium]